MRAVVSLQAQLLDSVLWLLALMLALWSAGEGCSALGPSSSGAQMGLPAPASQPHASGQQLWTHPQPEDFQPMHSLLRQCCRAPTSTPGAASSERVDSLVSVVAAASSSPSRWAPALAACLWSCPGHGCCCQQLGRSTGMQAVQEASCLVFRVAGPASERLGGCQQHWSLPLECRPGFLVRVIRAACSRPSRSTTGGSSNAHAQQPSSVCYDDLQT